MPFTVSLCVNCTRTIEEVSEVEWPVPAGTLPHLTDAPFTFAPITQMWNGEPLHEPHFSWGACDGCRSNLGDDRYDYAIHDGS